MSEPNNSQPDIRDCIAVDEEWIQHKGKVYRRIRWAGEEWSQWELAPCQQFPWHIVEELGALRK
jgi:hypothetical protein